MVEIKLTSHFEDDKNVPKQTRFLKIVRVWLVPKVFLRVKV